MVLPNTFLSQLPQNIQGETNFSVPKIGTADIHPMEVPVLVLPQHAAALVVLEAAVVPEVDKLAPVGVAYAYAPVRHGHGLLQLLQPMTTTIVLKTMNAPCETCCCEVNARLTL